MHPSAAGEARSQPTVCIWMCLGLSFSVSCASVFLQTNLSSRSHVLDCINELGQAWCILSHPLQICYGDFQPPHQKIPSSQIVYNLSGINVEKYLVATADDFIRNRWMQPVFTLDISNSTHALFCTTNLNLFFKGVNGLIVFWTMYEVMFQKIQAVISHNIYQFRLIYFIIWHNLVS